MKTHSHKSGICFYWCFYFRFSVWKKTFLYIPGYLCEDREIMINAKVKKKKSPFWIQEKTSWFIANCLKAPHP